MKKALLVFSVLGIFFTTVAATCEDDKDNVTPTPTTTEPELKEYTCKCTYVASSTGPNAGKPNIEETTTLKARDGDFARVDCASLDGKYIPQHYGGTCVLQ